MWKASFILKHRDIFSEISLHKTCPNQRKVATSAIESTLASLLRNNVSPSLTKKYNFLLRSSEHWVKTSWWNF